MFKWFRKGAASSSTQSRRASLRPTAGRAQSGVALRSAPNPADLVLSAEARNWCHSLPTAVRPLALCESFARLANRLALVWPDAELTDRFLDDLIIDRRGGRKGFPPAVMDELIRLRAFRMRSATRESGTTSLAMKSIDFDPS